MMHHQCLYTLTYGQPHVLEILNLTQFGFFINGLIFTAELMELNVRPVPVSKRNKLFLLNQEKFKNQKAKGQVNITSKPRVVKFSN